MLGEFDGAGLFFCGVGLARVGEHRGDGGKERLSADDTGVHLGGLVAQPFSDRPAI
ncbi:hypothetical protein [Streptomyces sp. IBSBF 3136]|uniref:hypothetical protein n=1 Tax=Streptomyces sp. IBSBF 3136 TaxID=2903524 RepID=UPI002FDC5437